MNHEQTSLVIMQVCDRCISFAGHTRRAGLIYDPQNVTVVSLPEALKEGRIPDMLQTLLNNVQCRSALVPFGLLLHNSARISLLLCMVIAI